MCFVKVDPYLRNIARVQGHFELSSDVETFQSWLQSLKCCKGQGLQFKITLDPCNIARMGTNFELWPLTLATLQWWGPTLVCFNIKKQFKVALDPCNITRVGVNFNRTHAF